LQHKSTKKGSVYVYIICNNLGLLCREDYFEYFCVLKRTGMEKSGFTSVLLAAVMAVAPFVMASADVPKVEIKVILVSVSGDSTVLVPGESSPSTLNVPLHAEFISELVADDGKDYVLFPQWTVTRTYANGESFKTVDYLKRQESSTEYDFTDYGKFQVNFAWSYREKDSIATIPGDDVQSMEFTIDDSEIRLYNAFSPNGDGINDVYKIYTRSIVSIKISIFNRWGQTIKTISGPMEKVLPFDAEPDNDGGYLFEIWDGKYRGDVVNDGVYYLNVQATGAGGKKYEKTSDINVLKGLGTGN